MCNNSLDIDRSSLNGNYSLKRVYNFLVCERQILKRMDLLLKEMSALKFRRAGEKLYLPRLHFFLLNKSVDFSRHIYMVND